jgi:hypothetical protein
MMRASLATWAGMATGSAMGRHATAVAGLKESGGWARVGSRVDGVKTSGAPARVAGCAAEIMTVPLAVKDLLPLRGPFGVLDREPLARHRADGGAGRSLPQRTPRSPL